jgi:RHS repeat-associated protein
MIWSDACSNGVATRDAYKFTGKERDAESGLDMFGARYYGSSLGRFMQVDAKQFSVRTLVNPQKWNKYAYVLNNPLALVDPNGIPRHNPSASCIVSRKTSVRLRSNLRRRTSVRSKARLEDHGAWGRYPEHIEGMSNI